MPRSASKRRAQRRSAAEPSFSGHARITEERNPERTFPAVACRRTHVPAVLNLVRSAVGVLLTYVWRQEGMAPWSLVFGTRLLFFWTLLFAIGPSSIERKGNFPLLMSPFQDLTHQDPFWKTNFCSREGKNRENMPSLASTHSIWTAGKNYKSSPSGLVISQIGKRNNCYLFASIYWMLLNSSSFQAASCVSDIKKYKIIFLSYTLKIVVRPPPLHPRVKQGGVLTTVWQGRKKIRWTLFFFFFTLKNTKIF